MYPIRAAKLLTDKRGFVYTARGRIGGFRTTRFWRHKGRTCYGDTDRFLRDVRTTRNRTITIKVDCAEFSMLSTDNQTVVRVDERRRANFLHDQVPKSKAKRPNVRLAGDCRGGGEDRPRSIEAHSRRLLLLVHESS